jgi:hypothetical protein
MPWEVGMVMEGNSGTGVLIMIRWTGVLGWERVRCGVCGQGYATWSCFDRVYGRVTKTMTDKHFHFDRQGKRCDHKTGVKY